MAIPQQIPRKFKEGNNYFFEFACGYDLVKK